MVRFDQLDSLCCGHSKGLALFISGFTCAEKGCILDHGYKLSNDYSAEYRGKGNRQSLVLLVAQ